MLPFSTKNVFVIARATFDYSAFNSFKYNAELVEKYNYQQNVVAHNNRAHANTHTNFNYGHNNSLTAHYNLVNPHNNRYYTGYAVGYTKTHTNTNPHSNLMNHYNTAGHSNTNPHSNYSYGYVNTPSHSNINNYYTTPYHVNYNNHNNVNYTYTAYRAYDSPTHTNYGYNNYTYGHTNNTLRTYYGHSNTSGHNNYSYNHTNTSAYYSTPQHSNTYGYTNTPNHTNTYSYVNNPVHTNTYSYLTAPSHSNTTAYRNDPRHSNTTSYYTTPSHSNTTAYRNDPRHSNITTYYNYLVNYTECPHTNTYSYAVGYTPVSVRYNYHSNTYIGSYTANHTNYNYTAHNNTVPHTNTYSNVDYNAVAHNNTYHSNSPARHYNYLSRHYNAYSNVAYRYRYSYGAYHNDSLTGHSNSPRYGHNNTYSGVIFKRHYNGSYLYHSNYEYNYAHRQLGYAYTYGTGYYRRHYDVDTYSGSTTPASSSRPHSNTYHVLYYRVQYSSPSYHSNTYARTSYNYNTPNYTHSNTHSHSNYNSAYNYLVNYSNPYHTNTYSYSTGNYTHSNTTYYTTPYSHSNTTYYTTPYSHSNTTYYTTPYTHSNTTYYNYVNNYTNTTYYSTLRNYTNTTYNNTIYHTNNNYSYNTLYYINTQNYVNYVAYNIYNYTTYSYTAVYTPRHTNTPGYSLTGYYGTYSSYTTPAHTNNNYGYTAYTAYAYGVAHSNTNPHNNYNSHNNTNPHANTNPHINTYGYTSYVGHTNNYYNNPSYSTYLTHANVAGNHTNAPSVHIDNTNHANISYNNPGVNIQEHVNYIPSKAHLFNVTNNQKVSGTLKLGLYAYDKDKDDAGATKNGVQDVVHYKVELMPLGGPNAGVYQTIIADTTSEIVSIDTTNPSIYQGLNILRVTAFNPSLTVNGTTYDYIGISEQVTIEISQNETPLADFKNYVEFIGFTFDDKGVLTDTNQYKKYGSTLYSEASDSYQYGLYISINMKDNDTGQYQKGTVSINTGNGVITKPIIWDNGIDVQKNIVQSNGSLRRGYVYFSKDEFTSSAHYKHDVPVVISIQDYLDANCTQPAGLPFVQQYTPDMRDAKINIDKINYTGLTGLSVVAIRDIAWQTYTDFPITEDKLPVGSYNGKYVKLGYAVDFSIAGLTTGTKNITSVTGTFNFKYKGSDYTLYTKDSNGNYIPVTNTTSFTKTVISSEESIWNGSFALPNEIYYYNGTSYVQIVDATNLLEVYLKLDYIVDGTGTPVTYFNNLVYKVDTSGNALSDIQSVTQN